MPVRALKSAIAQREARRATSTAEPTPSSTRIAEPSASGENLPPKSATTSLISAPRPSSSFRARDARHRVENRFIGGSYEPIADANRPPASEQVAEMVNVPPLAAAPRFHVRNFRSEEANRSGIWQKLLARVIGLRKHLSLAMVFSPVVDAMLVWILIAACWAGLRCQAWRSSR